MPSKESSVEELLPWYVNGTLEAEEKRRVEAYLEEHPEAQEELRFLEAVRAGVKQVETSSDDLGWRRLQRELRKDTMQARSSSGWMRIALAASVAIILAQGALLAQREGDQTYRPLGEQSPVSIASTSVVLQVTFDGSASEHEIRSLLQEAGAVIVDGPSAVGVYRIALRDQSLEEAGVQTKIELLQSHSEIVTYVSRE